MTTFSYNPTYAYTDGSGYCSSFTDIELSYKALKERLIKDALREDELRLIAFDLKLDSVVIHGDCEENTYDVYVKCGPMEYRICRCSDDLYGFIHFLYEFRNADYVID